MPQMRFHIYQSNRHTLRYRDLRTKGRTAKRVTFITETLVFDECMRVEAVILDFDQTLVDLSRHIEWGDARRNMVETYIAHGVSPFLTIDIFDPLSMQEKMRDAEIPAISQDHFAKAFTEAEKILEEFEIKAVSESRLEPGALDALRWLRKHGKKIGVVSLNGSRPVRAALEKFQIADYFDAAFYRDSQGRPKPNPDHLLRCLKQLKCKPQKAVMIGDNTTDIMAAKSAGVLFIGVSSGGYSTAELKWAGAEKTIPSLCELPSVIEELESSKKT